MSEQARKVLRISGADAVHFLQGLVTNDVGKLADGAVYAAILTPQGKLRADFFLVPDGADILMDLDAGAAAQILPLLGMYKLRSDVTLAETDLRVSRGFGALPEGAFADPRPGMGWRGYAEQPGDDTDWDAQRVAHCVPTWGVELTGDTFILEAGFERLNGVDFKKGCYVGQEVTARMKHKTELRKGFVTVAVDGAAPVGTEIMAGGKVAGTLFTQSGGRAIAYLRFDRAGADMTAGEARVTYHPA